jgi:hypothetical protein
MRSVRYDPVHDGVQADFVGAMLRRIFRSRQFQKLLGSEGGHHGVGSRDMLGALRDGPPVGAGLEIPLGGGKVIECRR